VGDKFSCSLRTPRETRYTSPSVKLSVLNDHSGSGFSRGLSNDTWKVASESDLAERVMCGGIRVLANEVLYRRGRPARTPRLPIPSSSTRPLAAAPSTPIASSRLLLPTPFAPIKQLTRPNWSSWSTIDLKPRMWMVRIITQPFREPTTTLPSARAQGKQDAGSDVRPQEPRRWDDAPMAPVTEPAAGPERTWRRARGHGRARRPGRARSGPRPSRVGAAADEAGPARRAASSMMPPEAVMSFHCGDMSVVSASTP